MVQIPTLLRMFPDQGPMGDRALTTDHYWPLTLVTIGQSQLYIVYNTTLNCSVLRPMLSWMYEVY